MLVNVKDVGLGRTCNQWPECRTNFHDTVIAYFDAVTVVSQALLVSSGCSLGKQKRSL